MEIPALPPKPRELAELETRIRAIRAELDGVDGEIREIVDADWRRQNHEDSDLDAAAERLARGEPEPGGVVPERLTFLQSRREILCSADRKVSGRIAEQRERYNRSIASALRPAHRACAIRIFRALVELVYANEAEERLRASVPGIPIRPANFPNVGGFGPHGGPAEYWRAWARRQGLIDEGDNFPMAAE